MNYMPRPGIVQASLCGMNVLIPSRAAYPDCKTILPLNLIGSIIWAGVERDMPMEKILDAYRIFAKKSDEELTEKVDQFCKILCEKGFAMPRKPTAKEGPAEGEQP